MLLFVAYLSSICCYLLFIRLVFIVYLLFLSMEKYVMMHI